MQASGVLLLQQLAEQPGKSVLGIHPVSQAVQKLPAAAAALTAIQVGLLLCASVSGTASLLGTGG